ncbi:hypothetical protein CWI37_1274p0010 [Hamiltosporidium tvaerminnensis]|uniref:Uncharacterized protein n=2 Tax=Hamiltosporidium TaxID=1176354 RepID=A0A4Q9L6G6_9MICR|nr:hypothetical protein LUQ84_003078 [Hamiltosporidium tvaerminnensis]TBT99628.1 hypothetical protein CWI37_1274p0010 [Hamiltosporidium tvaerminnensis]TBU02703.1 hypothetical protein CWI39_1103p0010 [Hamiltosporidium magnivora]TBU03229.1 hypothetical protein CWI36_0961p0020 [Hamiltosporidium magnivora]
MGNKKSILTAIAILSLTVILIMCVIAHMEYKKGKKYFNDQILNFIGENKDKFEIDYEFISLNHIECMKSIKLCFYESNEDLSNIEKLFKENVDFKKITDKLDKLKIVNESELPIDALIDKFSFSNNFFSRLGFFMYDKNSPIMKLKGTGNYVFNKTDSNTKYQIWFFILPKNKNVEIYVFTLDKKNVDKNNFTIKNFENTPENVKKHLTYLFSH